MVSLYYFKYAPAPQGGNRTSLQREPVKLVTQFINSRLLFNVANNYLRDIN